MIGYKKKPCIIIPLSVKGYSYQDIQWKNGRKWSMSKSHKTRTGARKHQMVEELRAFVQVTGEKNNNFSACKT